MRTENTHCRVSQHTKSPNVLCVVRLARSIILNRVPFFLPFRVNPEQISLEERVELQEQRPHSCSERYRTRYRVTRHLARTFRRVPQLRAVVCNCLCRSLQTAQILTYQPLDLAFLYFESAKPIADRKQSYQEEVQIESVPRLIQKILPVFRGRAECLNRVAKPPRGKSRHAKVTVIHRGYRISSRAGQPVLNACHAISASAASSSSIAS